jgi:hypothetical protein
MNGLNNNNMEYAFNIMSHHPLLTIFLGYVIIRCCEALGRRRY